MTKPKAVIFDMDGTLCDVSSIRHLVTGKRKDFDGFHYASLYCPTNRDVELAAHRWHANGYKVVIVTARRDRWRTLTWNWLDSHAVPWNRLFMRADNDNRPDRFVKADILADVEKEFDVVHAFDDNPVVIELWQERGIPTTVVPGWPDGHAPS